MNVGKGLEAGKVQALQEFSRGARQGVVRLPVEGTPGIVGGENGAKEKIGCGHVQVGSGQCDHEGAGRCGTKHVACVKNVSILPYKRYLSFEKPIKLFVLSRWRGFLVLFLLAGEVLSEGAWEGERKGLTLMVPAGEAASFSSY